MPLWTSNSQYINLWTCVLIMLLHIDLFFWVHLPVTPCPSSPSTVRLGLLEVESRVYFTASCVMVMLGIKCFRSVLCDDGIVMMITKRFETVQPYRPHWDIFTENILALHRPFTRIMFRLFYWLMLTYCFNTMVLNLMVYCMPDAPLYDFVLAFLFCCSANCSKVLL